MPQSRKSTPPKTLLSKGSRGMSEGPKLTATRAMDDRPKGTDQARKTVARNRRTTHSETDSE
jgi:hypothetical protein